MRIVIAGCGRVGGELAERLAAAGHDVSIIDTNAHVLEALGSTFNGTTHLGLAYDVDVLREAGIKQADAFVAVTNSDNGNLMAVEVAKEVFAVPRTLARLDDPAREKAYRALDINYVAASRLVANVIFESILDAEFEYHLTFAEGDIEVLEMTIGSASPGLTVEDLEIDAGLRVAAVRRGNNTFIPATETALEPGDLVVAAIRSGARSKIKKHLAGEA